jgi:GNAT superfamily N-acetyltransferase
LDRILNDLSPGTLAAAVKNNLYAYFRLLGNSTASQQAEYSHGYRWYTAIPHPWFNGMLSLAPVSGDRSNFIRQATRYFTSHHVASFTWWLAPELHSDEWSDYLFPFGFRYSQDTPGMAIDLAALSPGATNSNNFTIQEVKDLAGLKVWARIFVQGYELPVEITQAYFDLIAPLGVNLPLRYYLGFQNGQPVATSTLFLAAGTAGIYNVATLPAARGHGFGTTLTLAPLLEARSNGYRAGVLQSSEMGYPVYRRMGFSKVCAMDHFYWAN